MANLAIQGHATRGKEVIEILEMLGGVNTHNLYGDENYAYYTIDSDKEIKGGIYVFDDEQLCHFTLEQFEEKFPYKVGDKVIIKCKKQEAIIDRVDWCCDTITYWLKYDGIIEGNRRVEHLQPYKEETMDKANKAVFDTNAQCCDIMNHLIKEETMESKPNLLQQLKEYFDNTPRDVLEKEWNELSYLNEIGPTVEEYLEYVKKYRQSTQYPKNYDECCAILNYETDRQTVTGYDADLIEDFQTLKLCRDAYWKIAGDWKPDFTNANERKYCIVNTENKVTKWTQKTTNKILAFPTAEMRDAFYENFKELIEDCKELL